MGFDGSGTYTRTNGTLSGSNLWQQRAAQANPVISATEHDAEMNDVADALTGCTKANGSKAATGNQPMAGFKHTGVGDATANNEYVTYGQVTSTGVPNVISNGNVGIGTTTPAEQVHIKSAAPRIRFEDTDAGASTIYSQISGNSQFGSITIQADTGNASAGSNIRFEVDNTARAIINSNGNLLIGTETDDAFPLITQEYFYKASGSHRAKVTSDSIANTEWCDVTAEGTFSGTSRWAQLFVYKHSSITNACGSVRLQRQNGVFDVLWHDDLGNLRTSTADSNVGTTGGTVVGTQTSDERLKESITTLGYGLAEIVQLEPKNFCFKAAPDVPQLGFLAQQVGLIIPEAVYDTKEELVGEEEGGTKLAMDYSQLIPVLVNAVKELSTKVDSLEARIAALEAL